MHQRLMWSESKGDEWHTHSLSVSPFFNIWCIAEIEGGGKKVHQDWIFRVKQTHVLISTLL